MTPSKLEEIIEELADQIFNGDEQSVRSMLRVFVEAVREVPFNSPPHCQHLSCLGKSTCAEPKECDSRCLMHSHAEHKCDCNCVCHSPTDLPAEVRDVISAIMTGLQYKVQEGLMQKEMEDLARLCLRVRDR